MIDIAMTATFRPELLDRTLDSFFTNLFYNHKEDLRLIINIDPVGNDRDLTNEVKQVAAKYFTNMRVNRPNSPNFPKAFHTVWSLCQTEFVFNLEEDWELLHKLDFDYMLEIMRKAENIAHLRLCHVKSTKEHIKVWNHFFPWNGSYFKCQDVDRGAVGWCGHPSLNRLSFMQQVLPRLNNQLNPEKQIKGRYMGDIIDKWDFGIFAPQDHPCCTRDIGRKWMEEHGWKKMGGYNHEWFTTWEKRRGNSTNYRTA